MTAQPPVAQTVLLRVSGLINGLPWNNLFHVRYTGTAPTPDQMNTIAAQTFDAYNSAFTSFLPSTASLLLVESVDLTSPMANSGQFQGNQAGTRVGTPMQNSLAAVVSWHINYRYRGGHPRTYLPAGVLEDIGAGRLWLDPFPTELGAAALGFRAALNLIQVAPLTFAMVSVSYTLDKAPRPSPMVFVIDNAIVHTRIDSQRRRLGKEIK
jgi:hypothetical protein